MIDLEVNNAGDIVLERPTDFPKMDVSFVMAAYPALQIQFMTAKNEKAEVPLPETSLSIRFKINEDSIKGIGCSLINEKDALRQLIMLRLRTECGDIYNQPGYGSRINDYKHTDIRSETIRNKIASIVYDIVKDLLEEPSVIIKGEQSSSFFYCQNLNIYIYENGRLFFSFPVEV